MLFCCLRIHQQACSSCSVLTDFAACSIPPPPYCHHASTLTPSLGCLAAARVCFPPRCKPGIKGIPRDVKLPSCRVPSFEYGTAVHLSSVFWERLHQRQIIPSCNSLILHSVTESDDTRSIHHKHPDRGLSSRRSDSLHSAAECQRL